MENTLEERLQYTQIQQLSIEQIPPLKDMRQKVLVEMQRGEVGMKTQLHLSNYVQILDMLAQWYISHHSHQCQIVTDIDVCTTGAIEFEEKSACMYLTQILENTQKMNEIICAYIEQGYAHIFSQAYKQVQPTAQQILDITQIGQVQLLLYQQASPSDTHTTFKRCA